MPDNTDGSAHLDGLAQDAPDAPREQDLTFDDALVVRKLASWVPYYMPSLDADAEFARFVANQAPEPYRTQLLATIEENVRILRGADAPSLPD